MIATEGRVNSGAVLNGGEMAEGKSRVLRGAGGWMSVRARVEAMPEVAALDPAVRVIIARVVRSTRLFAHERFDVARELAAHFADGAREGKEVWEMINDFGDPAQAAKMIGRAKRKGRPPWYRWTVRVLLACAACVLAVALTYGILAARFYWGSPTIAKNYAKELNEKLATTPESERAWPLFIQAVREGGVIPDELYQHDWPTNPSEPGWKEATEYLQSHQQMLATIRLAASKPALGMKLGTDGDAEYMKAMEVRSPSYKYAPGPDSQPENPVLLGILLPHLGEFRSRGRLLTTDAALAKTLGDRERFLADVRAILGMSRLCRGDRFLISMLVSFALDRTAQDIVKRGLAEKGLLSDDDLRALAREIEGELPRPARFDFAFEQFMYEDILQRFYTDDGSGDGHPIAASIDDVYRDFGAVNPLATRGAKLMMPLRVLRLPSRARVRAQIERYSKSFAADEELPLWRNSSRTSPAEFENIQAMGLDMLVPFMMLIGDGNPASNALISRDVSEAEKDATLVAIALELYKRRTGEYPQSLQQMVGKELKGMPADPFTGAPMLYVLDGEGEARSPVLYSVGVDGVDDHGQRATDPKGKTPELKLTPMRSASRVGELWGKPKMARAEVPGDWVLYDPGQRSKEFSR